MVWMITRGYIPSPCSRNASSGNAWATWSPTWTSACGKPWTSSWSATTSLVGGLEHFFIFPFSWEFHNPNWLINSLFSRNKNMCVKDIFPYMVPSSVSPPPPPWVGSPGSSPNSLLFASYWQHFWGPAAYLLGLCSISDYQPRIY